ncbi:MAG: ATPase domain-containing protein [Sulfolobales archaeon]|nr:AAA family ATPase [Sulfolobales archaeon]MDW7969717.1 ATPase domain-containing protein [Sulfolobales archaeon]
MSDLVFGIEYLDNLYSRALKLNPLIVIAGHPGSGKTTLACTMCYANTVKGNKCVYITFYEDKEKLYDIMSGLGLDLRGAESKGLFKFIKIPLSSSQLFGETLMDSINDYSPNIVVIDSMTPILIYMKSHEERRAFLQNFLYELPNRVKGAVVLVYEALNNYIEELNDVSFVADVVLYMRNVVEKNILTRVMEIRKMRGCDIKLGEIPYSISGGKGIELYPKPFLEDIPSDSRELKLPCKILERHLGHGHLGMSVYITHYADNRPLEPLLILTGLLVLNDLKCLYIVYNQPPKSVKEQIIRVLKKYGMSEENAERVVDNHYTFISINPYLYSLESLIIKLMSLSKDAFNSDVVVFNDVSLVGMVYNSSNYLRAIYDNINYMRYLRKLTVRIGSYIDEEHYRLNSMVSDIIFKVIPDMKESSARCELMIYLWRRGMEAALLRSEEIQICCEEIVRNINDNFLKS